MVLDKMDSAILDRLLLTKTEQYNRNDFPSHCSGIVCGHLQWNTGNGPELPECLLSHDATYESKASTCMHGMLHTNHYSP